MWQVKAACYKHHYEKHFKNHSWPCFRVGLDQMTFRDPFQPKLLYNILKCLFPLLFQIHFPSIFLLALTNTLDYITHSLYRPHKLLSHIFNQFYSIIQHLASPWFFHWHNLPLYLVTKESNPNAIKKKKSMFIFPLNNKGVLG